MDANKPIRPLFFPRGVADLDAAIGCTAHAGIIYGLDLQHGSLRWQTSLARRPLLIHGGRLFASEAAPGQANILRVHSLDLDDPAHGDRPASEVVFPHWVDVTDA